MPCCFIFADYLAILRISPEMTIPAYMLAQQLISNHIERYYNMNKKVAVIFILTLAALGYLTYYSFGPSSTTHIGPQVNPESLKPAQTTAVSQNNETLKIYHNKDIAENFYYISIPQSWQNQSSTSRAGEYDFNFSDGTARVELMDVPDNSTLELFVLSQEEPQLKNLLTGYKRIDYQKINISGNDAYQLVYSSDMNGVNYESIRTYIAGPDHAAAITFSLPQTRVASMKNTFDLVTNSFSWENK
jgi:hypothetical protein